MKKYLMETWHYDHNSVSIVEAGNINEAFAEFFKYYGTPYPLTIEDLKNLFKYFTIEKFIEYFEKEQCYSVYGIYEIKDTLFRKVVEE